MQTQIPVPGHAPSLLPEVCDWKLVWNDEFDGTELDRTKWGFRLNYWGRPCKIFAEEGVDVSDSCVRLRITQKDGVYRTPFLQTGSLTYDLPREADGKGGVAGASDWPGWPFGAKEPPRFQHRYGYYECRCKLQKHPGWWSAFWLQSPDVGATLDPGHSGVECDIMESFHPGKIIPHWCHYNGYGADYRGFCSHRLSAAEANKLENEKTVSLDEFHLFGVHWESDGYTFYVDGLQNGFKVGAGAGEAVSHTEQFILLSCECMNYRWGGKPSGELEELAFPNNDCFTVDHVRVFDEVPLRDRTVNAPVKP